MSYAELKNSARYTRCSVRVARLAPIDESSMRVVLVIPSGSSLEAKTGEIYLDDDDSLVVEKMVDYLYKLDYTVDDCLLCPSSTQDSEELPTVNRDGQEEADQDPPSLFHARMYTVGENYGISGLKALAKEKSEAAVQHIWCGGTFYSFVRFIYGSTEGGLRDVISSLACQNITSLKEQQEFAGMLEEFPPFALDLLWEMIGKTHKKAESTTPRSLFRVHYDQHFCGLAVEMTQINFGGALEFETPTFVGDRSYKPNCSAFWGGMIMKAQSLLGICSTCAISLQVEPAKGILAEATF
ncbi:hypothetical protein ACJ73_07047 [Blastomyces percursus]|uniref:BTB domain-containing protein n=1 Tax=Blastomyces percursus TaxID=1658174 RepID=A0A1J9PZ51_9EURO|nr:hypothetical protein ACJ73_07047 [Blastomyces percursus]